MQQKQHEHLTLSQTSPTPPAQQIHRSQPKAVRPLQCLEARTDFAPAFFRHLLRHGHWQCQRWLLPECQQYWQNFHRPDRLNGEFLIFAVVVNVLDIRPDQDVACKVCWNRNQKLTKVLAWMEPCRICGCGPNVCALVNRKGSEDPPTNSIRHLSCIVRYSKTTLIAHTRPVVLVIAVANNATVNRPADGWLHWSSNPLIGPTKQHPSTFVVQWTSGCKNNIALKIIEEVVSSTRVSTQRSSRNLPIMWRFWRLWRIRTFPVHNIFYSTLLLLSLVSLLFHSFGQNRKWLVQQEEHGPHERVHRSGITQWTACRSHLLIFSLSFLIECAKSEGNWKSAESKMSRQG